MGLHRRKKANGDCPSGEAISRHDPNFDNETIGKTSFLFSNIQGLKTKQRYHKIKMLSEMAISNNTLIMALTESHLNVEISEVETQIDGFTAFRADRTGNIKGGIIVYIKDKWQSQISVLAAGSINLVEYLVLYIEKINLILITVYRSPSSDRQSFSIVMDKIYTTIMLKENCRAPLNGDFNFPEIKFEHAPNS